MACDYVTHSVRDSYEESKLLPQPLSLTPSVLPFVTKSRTSDSWKSLGPEEKWMFYIMPLAIKLWKANINCILLSGNLKGAKGGSTEEMSRGRVLLTPAQAAAVKQGDGGNFISSSHFDKLTACLYCCFLHTGLPCMATQWPTVLWTPSGQLSSPVKGSPHSSFLFSFSSTTWFACHACVFICQVLK